MGKLKVLVLGVENRLKEIPLIKDQIKVEDVMKYIGKELSINDLDKITIKLRGRVVSIDDVITTPNKLVVRVDAPPQPEVMVECKKPDCGFWGLKSRNGLCSVCFGKSIEKKTIKGLVQDNKEKEELIEEKIEIKPDSLTKCRRDDCKRVVGLLGFSCRCGGIFCGKHRIAEYHNCTFDFKKSGREKLEKDNPGFSNKKLRTI